MKAKRLITLALILGCGEFSGRIDGEIIDDAGGEVTGESAALVVPADAVDAPILMRIDALDPTALPEFAQGAFSAQRIEPTDLELMRSARLTIRYNPADLRMTDPSELQLVRIDAEALAVQPGVTVDVDAAAVSADVQALGRFALAPRCVIEICAVDEVCGNGVDDDTDGRVDEGCDAPEEICGDGLDNNGDGRIDEGCPPVGEICDNGLDDDGDGLIDEDCIACEADADCARGELCLDGTCGADGDGDGVPDRNDNCPRVANAGQEDADGDGVGDACAPDVEICDRIDNDMDGRVDEDCER